MSPALAGRFFTTGHQGSPHYSPSDTGTGSLHIGEVKRMAEREMELESWDYVYS